MSTKSGLMRTKYEWHGRFALPGAEKHTLQGRLTFDPETGIRGEVFGHIPNGFPTISFLSAQGRRIVLNGCVSISTPGEQMYISDLRALSMLVERDSKDDPDSPLDAEMLFKEAHLEYVGLLEWTGGSAVTPVPTGNGQVTTTLKREHATAKFLGSELTLSICPQTENSAQHVTLSSFAFIHQVYAGPKSRAEAIAQAEKIRQMVTVCKGGTVWFDRIELVAEDDCRYWLLVSQGKMDNLQDHNWTLRPTSLVEACSFFERWSACLSWAEPLAVILMETWLRSGSVVQFLILALSQALEGAHRCRYGEESNLISDKAYKPIQKTLKAAIKEVIHKSCGENADALATLISSRLAHAHELSLNERLTRFSEEIPLEFWSLVKDEPEEWVKKVVRKRNGLTHISSGSRNMQGEAHAWMMLLFELEVFAHGLLCRAICEDLDRAARAMFRTNAAFHLARPTQA